MDLLTYFTVGITTLAVGGVIGAVVGRAVMSYLAKFRPYILDSFL